MKYKLYMRGATAVEGYIGRVWWRVPYWPYLRNGCLPRVGIEARDDEGTPLSALTAGLLRALGGIAWALAPYWWCARAFAVAAAIAAVVLAAGWVLWAPWRAYSGGHGWGWLLLYTPLSVFLGALFRCIWEDGR